MRGASVAQRETPGRGRRSARARRRPARAPRSCASPPRGAAAARPDKPGGDRCRPGSHLHLHQLREDRREGRQRHGFLCAASPVQLLAARRRSVAPCFRRESDFSSGHESGHGLIRKSACASCERRPMLGRTRNGCAGRAGRCTTSQPRRGTRRAFVVVSIEVTARQGSFGGSSAGGPVV
jgi:hypothetical protein